MTRVLSKQEALDVMDFLDGAVAEHPRDLLDYLDDLLGDVHEEAYREGYDAGYGEGEDAGYDTGRDHGYEIGYEEGHQDGYDEGKHA